MTVFLYGAYGTGNLGDDLLLKSALGVHGTEAVAIAYGPPMLENPPTWIDHDTFIGAPQDYLRAGDRLIFAGGGLFWAASHAEDMKNVAMAAQKAGCDVAVERIGAQGVHSNLPAATEMMALCSSITVRDHHSVEILKSLNVTDRAEYQPDFALILDAIPARNPGSRPRIGVNHSATPFFYDEAHRRKTLHCYSEVVATFTDDVDFVYIPHTRHFRVLAQNDIIYGEYFWHATGRRMENTPFAHTVEELLATYATLSGVVGWRYHLLATALRFEIPAAFFGQMGGHKYGALSAEHKLPQINFDLETREIIPSLNRFVGMVQKFHAS